MIYEMNSLLMTEFIALNPKDYSTKHRSLNEFKDIEIKHKRTIKGCFEKVVVKQDIRHYSYANVMNTNEQLNKEVVGISSFHYQLYTVKQNKVALTSLYYKVQMVGNINCAIWL